MAAAGRRRVTIKHVAREALVSTQTVSRVINERPDVAPETRQRVLDVIERLGYKPSALARSLIRQRSHTLGVVTAGLQYMGPSRTLNGITAKAEELGYTLLLEELADFAYGDVQPILDNLLARQVDGIIWAVQEAGDNREVFASVLSEFPVPIVFLTMHELPGWHIVNFDNYVGGRLATEHLLAHGHRHIGHITGPLSWWEARERRRGWEEALAEEGMAVTNQHCVQGNWSSARGEQAVGRLYKQFPQMTAVFVANDQMALGVLNHAHRHGIRVPQDLAVVGFDGLPEAAYFWPPLTTIYHNQNELGCNAVTQIADLVETAAGEEMPPPRVIWLQPELVVRESSGGAPLQPMVTPGGV